MITISITGTAFDALKVLPDEVRRATQNAINKTATAVKKDLVDKISGPTGIKASVVRSGTVDPYYGKTGGIFVKRASQRELLAIVKPSASAIPVRYYKFTAIKTEHPTRSRVFVNWPGGHKLAAGFINPKYDAKQPLSTRSHKGKLKTPRPALGPSVATLFKDVVNDSVISNAVETLQSEFDKQIQQQIAKRK